MADVFSVQIFFIVLRETLEASIIISVLLAFLKQGLGQPDQDPKVHRALVRQVWVGSVAGIAICLIIGGIFIGVFYSLGKDLWSKSEDLWEGIFSVIASAMITVMGIGMLRLNKMKEKWRAKLAKAILHSNENGEETTSKRNWRTRLDPMQWSKKYAMALLPFITTLREGLEAVVFIGGVSLGTSATAFPLPVICGLACGSLIGYGIYRGSGAMSIQIFLIASTCLLYLIGAALFSRAVWYFEMYHFSKLAGGDVAEQGSGPGSYNVKQSVWHVNCCNPETDNGWEIFNAILGWQNSATYGSVLSYNLYWLFVMAMFLGLMYIERYGRVPLLGRFIKRPLQENEADVLMQRAESSTAPSYKFRVSDCESHGMKTN